MLDGPLETSEVSKSPLSCFACKSWTASTSTDFGLKPSGELTALACALPASFNRVRPWSKPFELQDVLLLGLASGWLSKM